MMFCLFRFYLFLFCCCGIFVIVLFLIVIKHSCVHSGHYDNKEGRTFLFNDALNTFYLRLYDVRHMVKDHSYSKRGNLLPPHMLLFQISSKIYFICIIPQTG